MNIIRKSAYLLPLALLAVMSSCGEDKKSNPAGDPANSVKITTEVITRANVTKMFANGDKMNVFAKNYNSIESDDRYKNVVATYDGAEWKISPSMTVKEGETYFIYAVAPYNSAYTDGSKIPVKVADQVDLLYSGAGVYVNGDKKEAALTMRHAMSLMSFNIAGPVAGTLTSLAINGDEVYTQATFNIQKAKFNGTATGTHTQTFSKTIAEQGWGSDIPRMWMIPFSTKGSKATLTAVIDGKSYQLDIPEVEMKSGYHYIFRLLFTKFGLAFDPTRTEIISLNTDDDQFGAPVGYGVLSVTAQGAGFTLPMFTGMGVFGNVKVGDNGFPFTPEKRQTVDLAASSKVMIETYNSTGFQLDDLIGVEEIDISEY